jgi:hypothetical protein
MVGDGIRFNRDELITKKAVIELINKILDDRFKDVVHHNQ